ncbi:MAG: IS66 family insertion sequence element accessory protein TnpB [Vulcanimicrobiota bacterium]
MRVLVAVEAVDGRKGIDSLARLCREKLEEDPFSGTVFLFLNRSRTTLKALVYDQQGFWLASKRLSRGTFRYWPTGDSAGKPLEAHQVQMLFAGGDPEARSAPFWRPISKVGMSSAAS